MEEKILPVPKRKIKFVFVNKSGEPIGDDKEELDPKDLTIEVIKFCWEGENINSPDGPVGPVPTELSPDLRKKLDDVYGPPPNIPTQTPRVSQEAFKSMNEGLDKEIQQTLEDLKREGVSEKEIKKIIEEDEEDKVSDIVRLTGGRKGKKWSIDEG